MIGSDSRCTRTTIAEAEHGKYRIEKPGDKRH